MPVADKTAVWYQPTLTALAALRSLQENWDGHGAARPQSTIANAVMSLLTRVMRDDTPAPSVVPTTYGGIQLEWHMRGLDIEVEFVSSQEIRGFFEDSRTGDSWEDNLSDDVNPLVEAITRLSSR
jgi:hypothetical protein